MKQEIDLSWVGDEYCPLFQSRGKFSHLKECTLRFQRLFKENPQLTKEEVLGATKLYLQRVLYIREPHYFISKGSGAERIQDILTWVANYHQEVEIQEYNNDTMQ